MIARICIAIALVAALAHAGAPKFTVTNAGTLTNVAITSPDANWKAGTSVTFIVSGNLASSIVAGSKINTVAKFFGTEVENKSDDLCTFDGTPFSCPESAGTKSWTFVFAIPTTPFAGTLTSHSDFVNADGSAIVSFDLSVGI